MIFALANDRTTLRGVGIPAWLWFIIAVIAIVVGIALLIADRAQRTSSNRERRRWAGLRGWQFAENDQILAARWEHGALVRHDNGVATDIVAGSTFTADGRRQVYILDLDVNGRTAATLVGVRCRRSAPTTAELWLPEVPVPQESNLDLLGPVGSRYAFVADVAAARPMLTPDLVEATDDLGADVTVVWFEQDWVLCATEPEADTTRLEGLLRTLGEVADLVDPFDRDPNESSAERQEPEHDPIESDAESVETTEPAQRASSVSEH